MFVLGTAGHIDHGKSSLIKAMTGIDPDRLPEEKERGMTIDLGFAWLNLPDGERVGFVDVPGHERFVRNMVAGAGGVNAAMLVVAADDGWMPQTQEHFDILRLLDIKYGLVAVTKIDLVEKDWLDLVVADVAAKVSGSFLDGAPISPVSSTTGEGVDKIVAAVIEIGRHLKQVEDIGKARLFIDRAFVLTGIGVVVTGTSRGGGFSADSDVYHFPAGKRVKIRTLQSHEEKVDRVGPGARVAINLSGVDREGINRGDVITGFDYLPRPNFLAVHVSNLNTSAISLKEGRKVLIIHGTTETEAIMRPFDGAGIKPGADGLAIIKTDDPLAAFVSDHFIARLPTPQVTIGGGMVLDILDRYPRRKELPAMADYLNRRRGGDLGELIHTELAKKYFMPQSEFLTYTNFSSAQIEQAVGGLLSSGEAAAFDGNLVLKENIADPTDSIRRELEKTHAAKSYLKGMTAEELIRILRIRDQEQFLLVLKYLESSGTLGRSRQFYHLPEFTPTLDEKLSRQAESIVKASQDAGHNYLTFAEIEAQFPGSRKTLDFLFEEKRLRAIGSQFVMPESTWKEIVAYIEQAINGQGKFTVADFRDRFGSSRKYALPVLEYLDRINITRREGDYRVKGADFNERHSL